MAYEHLVLGNCQAFTGRSLSVSLLNGLHREFMNGFSLWGMKKLLITVACLVAGAGVPARAQQGAGPEVVTVKVNERPFHSLQLIVSRDSGPAEVLTFDGKQMRQPGAKEAATQQVFAKLYREGFVVKTTFGGGDKYGNLNTLIFVREK